MASPRFFFNSFYNEKSFSLNIKLSLKVFDTNFFQILNLLIFVLYTLILLNLKLYTKIIQE